ncbi:MAG TPA: protein kinase [Polyangiaceae bacterium]|nr:protein kinase [Polyangiaceae bacterium]
MSIDSQADPMLGRVVLGRYRIVRPLARGGMGVIYLGRVEGAAGFSKPVVVKTVIPHLNEDSKMAGMFVREARILSNLQHTGIVGVVDFGQVGEAYLMVLEYVHGYHLGQWGRYLGSQGRHIEVDHAIYIAAHVLDALHYAHRQNRPDGENLGIVHRDVSPANILIDVQGHIKLHDFGIARMRDEGSEYKTQDGTFKGTLPFAAPETIQGVAASPQSDVYSCGVVLYQMLAGKNPFKGQQPSETLHRVLTHLPPPISVLRDDVPPEVDAAVARAIAKAPADRFETAAAFAEALRGGRAHSEDEIGAEFAALVSRDFNGEMPVKLGLESLESRDQAWRELQDGPPTGRFSLSSAPPAASNPPTMQGAVLSSGRLNDPLTTKEAPQFDDSQPQKRRSMAMWLAAGVGVMVLGGGVGFFLTAGNRQPAPSAPRFLVIEKQAAGEAPGTGSAAPADSPGSELSASGLVPSPLPSASAATPSAGAAPGGAKPAAGSDAASLSRAFQKQQGRIEQCFLHHAKEVEGQPRIAVRFSIDTSGAVQRAELNPASLSGTELGGCILSAARGTQFGAQPESLTFTIPITARRSQ